MKQKSRIYVTVNGRKLRVDETYVVTSKQHIMGYSYGLKNLAGDYRTMQMREVNPFALHLSVLRRVNCSRT